MGAVIAGAGPLAGWTGPARAAGGASGWSEIRMEQTACIAAGRRAVQQLGFDPSNDDQTVFGWQNQNLIAIRCIATKTVAVFFSYMGTEPEARDIIERLRPFFEGAAATPPATPPATGGGKGNTPTAPGGGK
jgi:hypothetical protein